MIPPEYSVLFLQSGATTQFAAVPLNLCSPDDVVDFIVTGSTRKKGNRSHRPPFGTGSPWTEAKQPTSNHFLASGLTGSRPIPPCGIGFGRTGAYTPFWLRVRLRLRLHQYSSLYISAHGLYSSECASRPELTQSASTQGITPPNELDVWCDVVGTKNGRIYGLGMESTVIRGWPYYHGTSSSNGWIQSQELEKLKKDLEGVKQERDELRIKIVNIERLFEENNAMIRQWMNSINRQSMPLSFE
ncbi:phosphoserine aminotransferase [Vigna unguiculata]|uniref:Phosphoserine aminotransferase n=1 Tax=Vigna unguiculata TaxID=3917 RepID=A0A4D6LXN5_VIGUN|nr:phosphoserine aminotransferase [Vigna unguiculata]